MTEQDIRALLFDFLERNGELTNSLIVEEVPVGQGSVKADIVIMDEVLRCYEIKSESDSLRRLIRQGWHYNRAFNQVTLVAASKHIHPSREVVPNWWGIYEITPSREILVIREPGVNPDLQTNGLSELLTREESLSLLEELASVKGVKSKSTRVIHEKLAEICDLNLLNEKALSFLKIRYQKHATN